MKIGVFDSGFGGLTVLRELLRLVPADEYLYFGDTARLPYGSKSAETVARYATSAAHFLEERGIDRLVIACNTASALALEDIARAVRVPVLGVIEPGAESASQVSRSRNVVVIGTEATVSSHAYRMALAGHGIEAHEKACPLFVPLVEEGWIDHTVTEQVARIYIEEAFRDGSRQSDVLLLGCTHYPLIKQVLRRIVPEQVAIVDSAESTAQRVAAEVKCDPPASASRVKFFVTDSVQKFHRLGQRFLGHAADDVVHVKLE